MTLWRPYVEDPLFTAELVIGLEALPDAQTRSLIAYLEALAERRKVVHPSTAFNAVYFGYDLEYGGYVGGPVDFDLFPEANTEGVTLPIGAMLNLATGAGPLYGEVLYKEGAHPALDRDGAVPAWLSGAPPGSGSLGDPAPPVERLVVDFDAFGQGLTIRRERLERLRRKGRLLDPLGHLLLPSQPDSDDSYVRYLLGPALASLVSGPLPHLLGTDADEEELEAGVRGALNTLDALLSLAEGLRRWGPYAFPRAHLAARLADDGPLGGGDLRSIVNGLTTSHETRRRFQTSGSVRYTSIGSRLRSIEAASPQLQGVGYAAAVCQANAVVSNVARGEADDRGVLPSGGHLRLDDAWQGGGIWRSSFPAGPHAQADPLVPLGLGWLESLPSTPEEHPDPEPVNDDRLTATDSQVNWTCPLRLWHVQQGVIPLPEKLAGELTHASIRLRLTHDGLVLDPQEADQQVAAQAVDGGLRLTGISWPLEYFPGILLDFWWPRDAPTLYASSTLLDVPELVNGERLEHRYDPGIITRDHAPGCTVRAWSKPLGLGDRILRAVRRAGLLQQDGAAVLPEAMLARAVFGTAAANPTVLSITLAELVAKGSLEKATGSQNRDGSFNYPGRAAESPVAAIVWRPQSIPVRNEPPGHAVGRAALERKLKSHEVQSFLRRLRPGERASEAKRAEYRRVSEHFGFGAELPVGYTLVGAHRRGGRPPFPVKESEPVHE
ncbi:hypothetical protein [Nonomuraea jabiensis]|uniref:hypothetical protein n=1 Tax=Nonomuraea jabiensis TaxID=882448 RepID=UPI003D71A5A5